MIDLDVWVIWLWCDDDEDGGGDGWRITEVNIVGEAISDGEEIWTNSLGEAETTFKQRRSGFSGIRDIHDTEGNKNYEVEADEDEDDDAYWRQYDDTPARTPAVKRSPAPQAITSTTDPNPK